MKFCYRQSLSAVLSASMMVFVMLANEGCPTFVQAQSTSLESEGLEADQTPKKQSLLRSSSAAGPGPSAAVNDIILKDYSMGVVTGRLEDKVMDDAHSHTGDNLNLVKSLPKKSLKEKTQDLSNSVDALAMGSHDDPWLATEANSNAFFQVRSLNALYLKDTQIHS